VIGVFPTPPGVIDSLPKLANHLLNIMLFFAYPLAFIAVVYTAYMLVNSGNKPEGYATAKKNIMYLATGIFLIIFSSILVPHALSLLRQTAPWQGQEARPELSAGAPFFLGPVLVRPFAAGRHRTGPGAGECRVRGV
jgi:hypothetical protein